MTDQLISYFKHVPEHQDKKRYKEVQTLIDVSILDSYPQYEARLYHLFEVMYGIKCLHQLPTFEQVPMHVLPKTEIQKQWVLPIHNREVLTLGIDDPTHIQKAFQLYAITNKKILLVFIRRSIFKTYFKEYEAFKTFQQVYQDVSFNKSVSLSTELTFDQNRPFIKYSDQLLTMSHVLQASDIHLTCNDKKGYIKYRIHGALKTYHVHDVSFHDALIRRYKVLSKLHVGMDHLPQDGMFYRQSNDGEHMYRIASIPTFYGEHMVIRVIETSTPYNTLDDLGMTHEQLVTLKEKLQTKQGMILVAGATGSGKSTTNHAIIQYLKKDVEHILTIEDPIEKIIENTTQIKINDATSLSYEKALKHVLRLDPDIVMIGEIRDEMSAQTAMRASLTGHIVLSSIHANTPEHIIERLKGFQITQALHHTVKVMVFQTLVPYMCKLCKGEGCQYCKHTGIESRHAIFELFVYDSIHRQWIKKGATIRDSIDQLYNQGLISKQTYIRFINSFE